MSVSGISPPKNINTFQGGNMNSQKRPTIITLAKNKGGVGSTTLAHALASVWSQKFKILLWDLDPQATLTMAICDSTEAAGYDVLVGNKSIEQIIAPALPSYRSNLKIIPAGSLLAKLDIETASRFDRAHLVDDALSSLTSFDIVLIDTPPSQGSLLTVGPLTAADYAILPCTCDDASFQQVSSFQKTIDSIKKRLNPKLQWLPIVANAFDNRQTMDREVLKSLRDNYRVFNTVIPRRVSIKEEMANRVPCTNSEIHALANEILEAL